MRFSIFGGVEASISDRQISLGGAKQRRTLAALLVDSDCRADTGQLVERIWHDSSLPHDELGALRTYISRLRTALTQDGHNGANILCTVADGYRLDPQLFELDRNDFESAARAATDPEAEPGEKIAHADTALACWTGPPFAGLADESWIRPEVDRLEALRLGARLARCEALIDLNRQEEALEDLDQLIAGHPMNERLRELRMIALHRSGRTVDALRTFSDFRTSLVSDLGVEPGPALRDLEHRLLMNETGSQTNSDLILKRIRGYELQEQIGEGSFATVWRATQPTLRREVAIKQIRAELANAPEFIRRFEAEGQLVASLEHPHIVPLIDFWREPNSAFLVMRLFRGGTLADQITNGTLTEESVESLIRQVGGALAVAHQHGVVHRDIKPANVFCDDLGNYFLGDFGIAQQHLPSEQHDRFDVDIAAFGSMIAETLPTLNRLTPATPGGNGHRQNASVATFARIVARATATEASERFGSIDDVLEQLAGPSDTATTPVALLPLPTQGFTGDNPYVGLRAFQENDANHFFGRTDLVDRLVRRINKRGADGRLVAVVGPSGSGKSSLVRAGLLPALRRGEAPGSEQWFITTMTPSSSPMAELDVALTRVATVAEPDRRSLLEADPRGLARATQRIVGDLDAELVLVIDQFEELFTTVASEAERQHLIDSIHTAVIDPRSRLRVVLTIRADFWDKPLQYGDFSRLLERNATHVVPMSSRQIESAIADPAERVGAVFEPGLVNEIANDVRSQPGGLPLLQHTLRDLFAASHSGLMTVDAYRKIGGVEGALAAKAEATFEEMTSAQPGGAEVVRNLFTRLVNLGEGTEDTRRRVPESELAGTGSASAIDGFGAARLLTFDRDPESRERTVELAHEALIREWPRLKEWIDSDRDDLRLHRHLTNAAAAWNSARDDSAELYRGSRLDGGVDLQRRHPARLSENEIAFLGASEQQRRRDEAQRVRQLRRLRTALTTAVLLLVVATVAGGFALVLRDRAENESARAEAARSVAETSRIAAEAANTVASDKRIALLQAAEVYRRDPSPETLGALQRVLTKTESYLGSFDPSTEYRSVAFSTDDSMAIGTHDGGIDAFDISTGQLVWSRPGDRLGVISTSAGLVASPLADGGVELIDDSSGDVVDTIPTEGPASSTAFDAAGVRLFIGERNGTLSAWDINTRTRLHSIAAHPETSMADLPAELQFDEGSRHEPRDLPLGVTRISVNEELGTVATTGGFFLRTWSSSDLEAKRSISVVGNRVIDPTLDESATSATEQVPRRPAGLFWVGDLIATSTRTAILLFDPQTGERVAIFDPFAGVSNINVDEAIAISAGANADEIVAVSGVGEAVVVRVATGEIDPIFDSESPSTSRPPGRIATSSDGRKTLVATPSGMRLHALDGQGLIYDARPLLFDPDFVGALVRLGVSSDGRYLFQHSIGQHPFLLDRSTGEFINNPNLEGVVHFFMDTPAPITYVDRDNFDAYYAASLDGLDSATRIPSGSYGSSAVSADRRYVAIATFAAEVQSVKVFDRSTGEPVATPEYPFSSSSRQIYNVAWSSDGRYLVAADDRGTVVAWETATWTALEPPIRSGGRPVVEVSFTPDGDHLLLTGNDGVLEVLDSQTFQPLGIDLDVARGSGLGVNSVRTGYSDDGRYLLAVYDEPTIVDTETWTVIGDPFPSPNNFQLHATPGGRYVATGNGDEIRIWNIDVNSWFDIACAAAGANLTESEWQQFGPRDSARAATCPQWD